jgi:hypothetical protein
LDRRLVLKGADWGMLVVNRARMAVGSVTVVDEIVVGVSADRRRWNLRRRLDLRSRPNATSPAGAGRQCVRMRCGRDDAGR